LAVSAILPTNAAGNSVRGKSLPKTRKPTPPTSPTAQSYFCVVAREEEPHSVELGSFAMLLGPEQIHGGEEEEGGNIKKYYEKQIGESAKDCVSPD
jgi:hypothetical protein